LLQAVLQAALLYIYTLYMSLRKSSSGKKGIPTPPPLPSIRSSKVSRKSPVEVKVIHHSGATIGYDGLGQVNWLKDVSTGKIYTEYANGPLDLTRQEIRAIEKSNDRILGRNQSKTRGGKRRNKTRKQRKSRKT
jgi:hypothetical protein